MQRKVKATSFNHKITWDISSQYPAQCRVFKAHDHPHIPIPDNIAHTFQRHLQMNC